MALEAGSRKRPTDGGDEARLEGRDLHRLELTALSDSVCQVRSRLATDTSEVERVERQQPMLLVMGAIERPQNENMHESLEAAKVVPEAFQGGKGWFSCDGGGKRVLSNSPVSGREVSRLLKASLSTVKSPLGFLRVGQLDAGIS
eukprot:1227170-Amphidinium_carterae.1